MELAEVKQTITHSLLIIAKKNRVYTADSNDIKCAHLHLMDLITPQIKAASVVIVTVITRHDGAYLGVYPKLIRPEDEVMMPY